MCRGGAGSEVPCEEKDTWISCLGLSSKYVCCSAGTRPKHQTTLKAVSCRKWREKVRWTLEPSVLPSKLTCSDSKNSSARSDVYSEPPRMCVPLLKSVACCLALACGLEWTVKLGNCSLFLCGAESGLKVAGNNSPVSKNRKPGRNALQHVMLYL